MQLNTYRITFYLPYYDDGFGDNMMHNVLKVQAPNKEVATEMAISHQKRMKRSSNGSVWQNSEIILVEKY